jgi:hypothetical protein
MNFLVYLALIGTQFLPLNGFANALKSQSEGYDQIKDHLHETLTHLTALEIDRAQKLMGYKNSRKFDACFKNNKEKACQSLLKSIADDEADFEATYNKVWNDFSSKNANLQSQIAQLPKQSAAIIVSSNLTFFETSYSRFLDGLHTENKANADAIKEFCEKNDTSDCLEATIPVLFLKYQSFIVTNKEALKSLETGTGAFGLDDITPL